MNDISKKLILALAGLAALAAVNDVVKDKTITGTLNPEKSFYITYKGRFQKVDVLESEKNGKKDGNEYPIAIDFTKPLPYKTLLSLKIGGILDRMHGADYSGKPAYANQVREVR